MKHETMVSRDITETIININHTFRFTLASKVNYWGLKYFSNMSIFTCKYLCGSGCEVLHISSYCCVWHSNNCRDTNEGSVRHRLRSRGPDQSPGSPLILPADPEMFVHQGWCRMSGGNCWDQSRKLTCSNRFIISRKSFRFRFISFYWIYRSHDRMNKVWFHRNFVWFVWQTFIRKLRKKVLSQNMSENSYNIIDESYLSFGPLSRFWRRFSIELDCSDISFVWKWNSIHRFCFLRLVFCAHKSML